VIRKITLKAEGEHTGFAQALASEPETLKAVGGQLFRLGLIKDQGEALKWFECPENYNGLSVKKARELAAKYKKAMEELDV
jgi:hypothetical protein